MNDIICTNCKKPFKIDESGFTAIVKQVRDHEFEDEINSRLKLAEKEKENEIKLAENKITSDFKDEIVLKEKEISELKRNHNKEVISKVREKEKIIAELKSNIENSEIRKTLEITNATKNIEKERDELINRIKNKEIENKLIVKSLEEKHHSEIQTKDNIIKMKDEEIDFRKEMKLKLSTKMIGETLEQHCESEFNKLRATGFQNASLRDVRKL